MRTLMKQWVVTALVLSIAWPAAAQPPAAQDPAATWKAFAAALPAGTDVEVRGADGTSVRGALGPVTDQAIEVTPRGRTPAPVRTIRLVDVRSIEIRDETLRRTREWKTLALSLRPGMPVDLELVDGAEFQGTLQSVSDDALVVNVESRGAVSTRSVSFSDIESMDAHLEEARHWKEVISRLRPGMRVGLDLLDGSELSGTVMSVSDDAVVVGVGDHGAVSTRTINFFEIEDVDPPGIPLGAWIGIVAGAVLIALFAWVVSSV